MWGYVAVFIVALFAAVALMPKPQVQPPAGFEQLEVPTAEEGREIAVLFGTRLIESPNVVWYGDFKTEAVQKKGGKK